MTESNVVSISNPPPKGATGIAPVGHNYDPALEAAEHTEELLHNADRWLVERKSIDDEETAGKAQAAIDQFRQTLAKYELARESEKRPHLEAGRLVDDKWRPILRKLEAGAGALKTMMLAWLDLKQQRINAEARRRQAEADEAARVAEEEQRRAAETGRVTDAVKAEEAATAATDAQKEADKAAAAKPQVKGTLAKRAMGIRETPVGIIVKYNLTLKHYANNADVKALVQRLVDADARRGLTTIPGVEISIKRGVS